MSKAGEKTVQEYLAALPEERRAVVAAVRQVVLRHLPKGYRETTNWGAITYEIPLERYPDTYNGQPLCYLALAAQKSHYALYLMSVYMDPEQETWLRGEFARRGMKLDLGKSCLRFRTLEDLPLDVVGQIVGKTTPQAYIARYEAGRQKTGAKRSTPGKAAARKSAGRKTAKHK